jgi:hypothetical protein
MQLGIIGPVLGLGAVRLGGQLWRGKYLNLEERIKIDKKT